jgi:hypothetical protein
MTAEGSTLETFQKLREGAIKEHTEKIIIIAIIISNRL